MSYKSEGDAIGVAVTQYEALQWAWTVCREEDDPAAVIKNMLESLANGRPKNFLEILEERKRGLK